MRKNTEGVFLDVIGTKILRRFLNAFHSHLHQLILLFPYCFLGLDNPTATAKSSWVLGFVYIISLFTFESSIVHSLIAL
jgi:hypothetical protein